MVADSLQVVIEYFYGQGQDEDGEPYYVDTCAQIGAMTDSRTVDEVLRNLREVIALAFEDEDSGVVYNVVPHPQVSIRLELSDYAQMA